MNQNPIVTMLTNQLQAKNPQAFQILNQAMKNQNNPMELFKQVTGGFNTEQMNNLMTQAKNMGFPPEVLEQVQNGINTK